MMMAVDRKKDQSGQALIELIIFLPLMFGLYGMIRGFANAINGSINQQKVTRAYYYFRIQNNSMVPRPAMTTVSGKGWSKFGMSYIGWADYLEGGEYPVSTCYQITIPLTPVGADACSSTYSGDTTQWIRVGTVYGVCGATFKVDSTTGQYYQVPDYFGAFYQELLDSNSCAVQ